MPCDEKLNRFVIFLSRQLWFSFSYFCGFFFLIGWFSRKPSVLSRGDGGSIGFLADIWVEKKKGNMERMTSRNMKKTL